MASIKRGTSSNQWKTLQEKSFFIVSDQSSVQSELPRVGG